MKLYCITVKKDNKTTAGAKAPDDISTIARMLGAEAFSFCPAHIFKNINITRFFALFVGIKNWMKLLFQIEKKAYVIVQHPNENILVANKFINLCKRVKKCRFIVLIHDLDSLRQYVLNDNSANLRGRAAVADEVLLKKADYIISHNKCMTRYLVERGFDRTKIVNLEIFDYLHNCDLSEKRVDTSKSIVVAGNLTPNKAAYIYQLNELGKLDYTINLFGPNYDKKENEENICYYGQCMPDKLPEKLVGKFGLVWDGTKIDGCHGNAGEYIKFNNPHKCSLFLASGLPVIIWKEAALASFVEKNQIGITVDSLREINSIMNKLDANEYQEMKKNAENIGQKLRQGYYFKKAMQEIMTKEGVDLEITN